MSASIESGNSHDTKDGVSGMIAFWELGDTEGLFRGQHTSASDCPFFPGNGDFGSETPVRMGDY